MSAEPIQSTPRPNQHTARLVTAEAYWRLHVLATRDAIRAGGWVSPPMRLLKAWEECRNAHDAAVADLERGTVTAEAIVDRASEIENIIDEADHRQRLAARREERNRVDQVERLLDEVQGSIDGIVAKLERLSVLTAAKSWRDYDNEELRARAAIGSCQRELQVKVRAIVGFYLPADEQAAETLPAYRRAELVETAA